MTKKTETSSTEQIRSAVSIRDQVAADEKLHTLANADNQGKLDAAIAKEPLTAERVAGAAEALVIDSLTAFYDPEERVLGTNGKAYPVDFDFGRMTDATGQPVENTGELTTVDRFGFIGQNLARLQCSGLEMMLRQQNESIARQRNSISNELRFGHQTGSDVSAKVDRMADFLGHMIEQAALIEIALGAAIEAYATNTGKPYLTKEDGAKAAKARVDSLPEGTADRLAKLGVSLSA